MTVMSGPTLYWDLIPNSKHQWKQQDLYCVHYCHVAKIKMASAVGGPVCRWEEAHKRTLQEHKSFRVAVEASSATHPALIMMEEYGCSCPPQ